MREEGYVEEVTVVTHGAFTLSAASAGASVLYVEDAADFNDEGGFLTIGETEYEYVSANMVSNTITLATGLAAAVEEQEEIFVSPLSQEKQALISVADNGDPITATVTHALFSRLPEGIRTEGREAVAIELVGGTWFVVDVIGQEPTPIKAEELAPEIVIDIDTALAEAEAAMGFALAKNRSYSQDEEPTGGEYAVGDIWFDTNDGNHMYRWNGTAWVDVADSQAAEALAAAQAAQDVADAAVLDAEAAMDFAETRNKAYRQDTMPTGGTYTAGDIWFDTNDGNRIYVHNGTTFVDSQDTGISDAIKAYSAEYAVNASETVAPTTGWSTATPTRTAGTFIWTRTVVTYNDNTTSTTNPALLTGNTGATGSQGLAGPAGADGTSLYTWLKYADTPTTGMSDSPTGKTYMGIAYNKTSATESSNYADYSWSLIKGADGSQGIAGPAGADGTTTYTWVKYADNASGGGMADLPDGKAYIGLAFNKTTATESTTAGDYQWSLIQGPAGTNGVGVSSITPYYQTVTTGAAAPAKPVASPPPAPWTTTEPNYVVNTELYRTDRIVYTDNTFAYTDVTKVSSYTAASTAMTTANGKNKIIFSTSDASGTAYSAGDVWFKKSGTLIIAQWEFVSGAWASRTLDSATIANLNVGKLVGGDISAITVNISASGVIKSTNYAASSAGWKLDANGLEMNTGVITGATYQTTSAVSRGVKITNTGLTAYDAAGVATLIIDGSTGAITMKGSLTSGSDVTGATITSSGSGVIQTEATAARGIKMNSTGFTAYDGVGSPTFTITASTGAVSMKGSLTSGSTIAGATVTGNLETTITAARGIKLTNGGFYAYDGSGNLMLNINASTGAISMKGSLTSGSDISGATITATSPGVIQTEATANRGIKMNSTGLTAYDNLGSPTLTITASTGAIAMKGTLTSGSSITGATFQTNTSGERIAINTDGANQISMYSSSGTFTLPAYIRSDTTVSTSTWQTLKLGSGMTTSASQVQGSLTLETLRNSSGVVTSTAQLAAGNVTIRGRSLGGSSIVDINGDTINLANETGGLGTTNVFGTLKVDEIRPRTGNTVNFSPTTYVNMGGTIKSGTRSCPVNALNTDYNQAVSFAATYPAEAPIPTVVVSANVTNSHHVTTSVTNITRSGFTIQYRRSAGATGAIDINWIAVGA